MLFDAREAPISPSSRDPGTHKHVTTDDDLERCKDQEIERERDRNQKRIKMKKIRTLTMQNNLYNSIYYTYILDAFEILLDANKNIRNHTVTHSIIKTNNNNNNNKK